MKEHHCEMQVGRRLTSHIGDIIGDSDRIT